MELNPERLEPVARAPRYSIRAPIYFRKGGEVDWREGTVVNISRTGVLFSADQDLLPKTILEMRVVLPVEVTTGEDPTKVACWGPVVRREVPIAPDSQPAMAAAISRYRLRQD